MDKIIKQFLSQVSQKNQNEPEFMQAVTEVAETVIPYIVTQDIYYGQNILLRMVEPERVVSFRVAWIDDNEEIQVNSCLLYTSPSPRDQRGSRMPSSA